MELHVNGGDGFSAKEEYKQLQFLKKTKNKRKNTNLKSKIFRDI